MMTRPFPAIDCLSSRLDSGQPTSGGSMGEADKIPSTAARRKGPNRVAMNSVVRYVSRRFIN